MTAPGPFNMGEPVVYDPVPISNETIERLREASRWSRFLAIAGFVLCGLLAVGLIVAIALWQSTELAGNAPLVAIVLPIALLLTVGVSGAALLFGYGRSVSQFFDQGEPALSRGFKTLRYFFALWTILVALTSVIKLLSLLGKLL
jgi:hypothetical protein